MRNLGGRGLWEGSTPPITALPDKNQGGDAVVDLASNDSSKRAVTLFRASGSSDYSWMATVDLGIDDEKFDPDAESPRNGSVVALVEWGHGAATFSAEVDFRRGAQFSVVATFINVSAFIDTDGGTDDGTILSAHVNGAVIWGTRPARSYATRTQTRSVEGSEEGSVDLLVQIPDFAETLTVAVPDEDVMDSATGPVTLSFLAGPEATDRALLTVDNTADFFRLAAIGNGCRFPNGSRSLLIQNGTGEEQLFSLIWGLAL